MIILKQVSMDIKNNSTRIISIKLLEKDPTLRKDYYAEEYISPDGKKTAVFKNLGEFAMGAYHYSLSIKQKRFLFPPERKINVSGYKKDRLLTPTQYQPWANDSKNIILTYLEKPPLLFNISNKGKRNIPLEKSWYQIILCSPKKPVALIQSYGGKKNNAFLMDLEDFHSIHHYTFQDYYTYVFWTEDGGHLLVVRQNNDERSSVLQLYDLESPNPLYEEDINPLRIVPYDNEKYRDLLRDHFNLCLNGNRGLMGVGSLMDIWNRIIFIPERETLYLKVERPTGEPKIIDKILCCSSVEKWVEIKLNLKPGKTC